MCANMAMMKRLANTPPYKNLVFFSCVLSLHGWILPALQFIKPRKQCVILARLFVESKKIPFLPLIDL